MNLKALKEEKNDLLDQIIDLVAKEAKEGLSMQERSKKQRLEQEVKNYDGMIKQTQMEIRNSCHVENTKFNEKGNDDMRNFLNSNEKTMKVELRADYLNTSAVDGVKVNPANVFEAIVEQIREIAPVVGEATVYPSTSGTLAVPVEGDNAYDAEFLGEGQRSELKKLNLDTVVLKGTRLQTAMRFTREMALDAGVDVENFVAKKCAQNIAYSLEKQAFQKYHENGFDKITDNAEVFTSDAANADAVVELVMSMKQELVNGAKLVMNRKTFAQLKKLKAADGLYILQPDMLGNTIYKCLGLEVQICEFVDDNEVVLINPREALAMMIKNDLQLQRISDDMDNVLDFTTTVVCQMVVDVKVKRAEAIKVLKFN